MCMPYRLIGSGVFPVNLTVWLLGITVFLLVFLIWLIVQNIGFNRSLHNVVRQMREGHVEQSIHMLSSMATPLWSLKPLHRTMTQFALQFESLVVSATEHKTRAEKADYHDALTGLANRLQFEQNVIALIEQQTPFQLLLIDIDDFKDINDNSGQQTGNNMLKLLADLLKATVQHPSWCARLEGDEFAVVLPHASTAAAEGIASEILEQSRKSVLPGRALLHRLSLSIGIVSAPEQASDLDDLMIHADLALSYCKAQGKGRMVSLNEPELTGQLLRQRFMFSKVHIAIRDKRLALAFQPIYDVTQDRISHHEVLLRIQDEDGSYVSAFPLIQAAEKQRDVGALDKWVLNHVLLMLMQFRRTGKQSKLAVNISGISMSDPATMAAIIKRIQFSGCGDQLVLEITESTALDDLEKTRQIIGQLKALGCQVALDDFGIGYSSVTSMLELPFDYVKIDGSFIRKLESDHAIPLLLEFLVRLSKLKTFTLIAEFVETQKIQQRLTDLGIPLSQGYFIGKPELHLPQEGGKPFTVADLF